MCCANGARWRIYLSQRGCSNATSECYAKRIQHSTHQTHCFQLGVVPACCTCAGSVPLCCWISIAYGPNHAIPSASHGDGMCWSWDERSSNVTKREKLRHVHDRTNVGACINSNICLGITRTPRGEYEGLHIAYTNRWMAATTCKPTRDFFVPHNLCGNFSTLHLCSITVTPITMFG